MARKAPLCRHCGMPMKGHSKSSCLKPKLQSITVSPEAEGDDGTSIISSTPSFIIPETGPFRRQNPNYVLPSPPEVETLVLSSASFTPTEPVHESVNELRRSFPPPFQQFTPNWSRPSSPQQPSGQRGLKQQESSFVLGSGRSPALSPISVFGPRLGDSVRLVAGIYEIPNTTVKAFRSQALSNGIYCVPIEPLKKEEEKEEYMQMQQNVDSLPPSTTTTWIVTGPRFNDVDVLVAVLQSRGLVWQLLWKANRQLVKNIGALYYGVLALFLLFSFKFIFKW